MAISHHVNRKGSNMSANASQNAESTAGGNRMLVAVIPWILFTVLVAHSTLKLGAIAALASAVVIAIPGIRAGHPKSLEIGAAVTFIGFVIVAFLVDASTAHWVARYARGIAALCLAALAFGSLLFVPFTEQYAREKVPAQYWGSSKFKAINRRLTALWGFVFIAMVPFHIVAGTINTRPGNIVCNWIIPGALVIWGLKQTQAISGHDGDAAPLQPVV
jgi:hypothetical protein